MRLRIPFSCIFLLTAIAVAAQPPVVQGRSGLPAFREKIQNYKPLTIANLGGSITQAEGYRVMTDSLLRHLYQKTSFTNINAGVGGTGSDLGAFRLQNEVLSFYPDLVLVVFAVNDAATDILKVEKAMEGIVRHPTPEGHRLYAETMLNDIQQLSHSKATVGKWPKPRHADNLEKARILDATNLPGATSWKRATELPVLENLQKGLPHLLFTESENDSLVVHFYGTLFGIEDVIGHSACSVLLTIDGQKNEIIRFDKYASRYRRHYFFLDPLPEGEHTVVIRKGSAAVNKKGMLNVPVLDEAFDTCRLFIGNILVQ